MKKFFILSAILTVAALVTVIVITPEIDFGAKNDNIDDGLNDDI